MTDERLKQYFDRINYRKGTEQTIQTLTLLQIRHSLTFPFENLNPFLDIPVLLDTDTLFSKMIVDHRGGYCYEHNLFFLSVLKKIKFDSRGLSGRVLESGREQPRRTHMLIITTLNEKPYISDVGFGSAAPCMPLLLDTDIVHQTPFGQYRFIYEGDGYILESGFNGKWRPLYYFDLQEQFHEDFEVGNWFTSTNVKAKFKNDLMVSIKTEKCRYTLDNTTLTSYKRDGNKETMVLVSKEEIRAVLNNIFKLKLNNLPGLDIKLQELIERNIQPHNSGKV